MLDALRESLPNLEELGDGKSGLGELIRISTEVLIDESVRKEILQLTGYDAVLVIECLDKVSMSGLHSKYRALVILQILSEGDIKTIPPAALSTILSLSLGRQYLPRSCWIDPKVITVPSEPHISGTRVQVYCGTWNGGFGAVKVLRTSKQESPTKLGKVSPGVSGRRTTWARAEGVLTRTAFFQGGDHVEVRVVPVRPRVLGCDFPPWGASNCHTLDA